MRSGAKSANGGLTCTANPSEQVERAVNATERHSGPRPAMAYLPMRCPLPRS